MLPPPIESAIAKHGIIDYATFTQLALYDPEYGYYAKRDKERVGRQFKNDFYTAASLGQVFGRLVLRAAESLLCKEMASEFDFVEVGCEPSQDAFNGCLFPFKKHLRLAYPQALNIPKKSIVFGNEILDAQPFHRLIFSNKQWHERGVCIKNNQLSDLRLPELSDPIKKANLALPQNSSEGYELDISLAAEDLLKKLAIQDWTGAILLFDYGKNWLDFTEGPPQGSARAYYKHQLHDQLLKHPGEQDLTCHVCWDRLGNILQENGFTNIQCVRQESFFVNYAICVIEEIISKPTSGFDHDKQTLKELIHPQHMGSKFQVMFAQR